MDPRLLCSLQNNLIKNSPQKLFNWTLRYWMMAPLSLILFPWETQSQLFPSWFKNEFALTARTSPQAAFLPMSSLFWLLCLYKSTDRARSLSPSPLASWGCIPFRISPPPLGLPSPHPLWSHVYVYWSYSGTRCAGKEPRKQTRKRVFNRWVSTWMR